MECGHLQTSKLRSVEICSCKRMNVRMKSCFQVLVRDTTTTQMWINSPTVPQVWWRVVGLATSTPVHAVNRLSNSLQILLRTLTITTLKSIKTLCYTNSSKMEIKRNTNINLKFLCVFWIIRAGIWSVNKPTLNKKLVNSKLPLKK